MSLLWTPKYSYAPIENYFAKAIEKYFDELDDQGEFSLYLYQLLITKLDILSLIQNHL